MVCNPTEGEGMKATRDNLTKKIGRQNSFWDKIAVVFGDAPGCEPESKEKTAAIIRACKLGPIADPKYKNKFKTFFENLHDFAVKSQPIAGIIHPGNSGKFVALKRLEIAEVLIGAIQSDRCRASSQIANLGFILFSHVARKAGWTWCLNCKAASDFPC